MTVFLCSPSLLNYLSSEVNFFSSIASLFLFCWLPVPLVVASIAAAFRLLSPPLNYSKWCYFSGLPLSARWFGLGLALSCLTLVRESSEVAPDPPVRALLSGLSGGEIQHWLWPSLPLIITTWFCDGCYLVEESTSDDIICGLKCWSDAADYLSFGFVGG